MGRIRLPDDVLEFFRKTGAMGGKARAKKHTPAELSRWGKKGGRPKGSGSAAETIVQKVLNSA